MKISHLALFATSLLAATPLCASVVVFGTEDCLGTGCYGAADPTAGATLSGLAAGTQTSASNSYGHGYPFAPSAGDFAGTDQIYVGATQTAAHDGYSSYSGRVNGPLVLTLNYGSAIPVGQTVQSLTLGLALDDFQNTVFGQPFTVSVDGVVNTNLTNFVNGLNETGPVVQFFTFGLNPALDNASHTLTISIAEGGDGGDGFAVDFATVGVTTAAGTATPEPATFVTFGAAAAMLLLARMILQPFQKQTHP